MYLFQCLIHHVFSCVCCFFSSVSVTLMPTETVLEGSEIVCNSVAYKEYSSWCLYSDVVGNSLFVMLCVWTLNMHMH